MKRPSTRAEYGGNPVFAPNAGTTIVNGIIHWGRKWRDDPHHHQPQPRQQRYRDCQWGRAFSVAGTLTAGAPQSWLNNSTNLFSIGDVNIGGFRLTIGGTGNSTVSGAIGGTDGVIKTGAGILILSDANGFTGRLAVQTGTVSLASIHNAGTSGTLGNGDLVLGNTGAQTGTPQYTGGNSSSDDFHPGHRRHGCHGCHRGWDRPDALGVIGGSGTLTETGGGTHTLSGLNTFSGAPAPSNPSLASSKARLGSGSVCCAA